MFLRSSQEVGVSDILEPLGLRKNQKESHNRLRLQNLKEKSRLHVQNILQQEVTQFITNQQISYEKQFKLVFNLQENIKKLKKDNQKLMENLKKQEEFSQNSNLGKNLKVLLKLSKDQRYFIEIKTVKKELLNNINESTDNLKNFNVKLSKKQKK